jgi:hypothetical protein
VALTGRGGSTPLSRTSELAATRRLLVSQGGRWESRRVSYAVAIALLAMSITVWGCGGGDTPNPPTPPVPRQTAATTDCENAMGGAKAPQPSMTTSAGPVGFYGTGRNFLTPHYKRAKIPIVIEGHAPVTLTIATRDREHAALLVGIRGSWAPRFAVRFVPCPNQPRTWWPAGFQLRNRERVHVIVQQAGTPQRELTVGRI